MATDTLFHITLDCPACHETLVDQEVEERGLATMLICSSCDMEYHALLGVKCKNQNQRPQQQIVFGYEEGHTVKVYGPHQWTVRFVAPFDEGPNFREIVMAGIGDVRIREGDRFSVIGVDWVFEQGGASVVRNETTEREWQTGPVHLPPTSGTPLPRTPRPPLTSAARSITAGFVILLSFLWLFYGQHAAALGAAVVALLIMGRPLLSLRPRPKRSVPKAVTWNLESGYTWWANDELRRHPKVIR